MELSDIKNTMFGWASVKQHFKKLWIAGKRIVTKSKGIYRITLAFCS